MTQKIENRINQLKEYVDKQRELIIGINNAIETKVLVHLNHSKQQLTTFASKENGD
jgi:hypothetical protein